ncbi:MAG: FtsX-like permease family protein [Bryobacteraceae bacterium]
MGRYASLVWKNAIRNRRRTLLTVTSLGFSLCLLGLMMAIYYALYLSDTPPAQALRLATRNKVSITLPMPGYYLQRIERTPGVREAMPWQWFQGVYKDERDPNNFFARFGVDARKLFLIQSEIRIPEEQKQAFIADRRGCIIGKKVSEKHGLKVGDRLTIKGDIYPMDLELNIHGIYDSTMGSDTLFFHWDYVKENRSLPKEYTDVYSSISILVETPESVPAVIAAIDDQFRGSPVQTRTETERAFALGFLNMMGNIKAILLSVCAAVTFTILLVSANTMAMSVRERVREVGILKTLGFKPGAILGIVLCESMLIAALGAVVGYGLAALLCGMIRQGPAFSAEIANLSIQPFVMVAMLVSALAIAVLSAIVPAWTASRVSILDALRHAD